MKIFVEEKWIDGTTCVFTIHNQFDKLTVKNGLRKMREAFIQKLKNQGYEIITNHQEVDEDTICLIMNNESLLSLNEGFDAYNAALKEKIASSAGQNFHYPKSVSIEEYFDAPFLPAVFKNELENGGKDKFLISTPEQIAIIKHYYDTHKEDKSIMTAFNKCIIQQFIETPTKYATYIRVLANGAGGIMGASLKCSKSVVEQRSQDSPFEKVFMNPDSPYFLNTTKMFNYYSGGMEINIPQPRYSSDKEDILKAHGFDMNNVCVPEEVLDVVKNIMHNCNPQLGVMCGMDFMLNATDGHWYYLENQAFPAIDEWAKTKDITISGVHSLKNYIHYNEIELQAREEALMSTIKYYEQAKSGETPKLTIKPPKENN